MNAVKQISLVMAGCLATVQFVCAQTWTQTSASEAAAWISVASSANGSMLVAAAGTYGIWISTNSGTTWTFSSAPAAAWSSVTCSADGLKISAAPTLSLRSSFSPLYTSTNSGRTWISNTVPINTSMGWVICSADGSKLTAQDGTLTNGTTIMCSSTNFGINWVTNYRPGGHWSRAVCSADGYTVLMAGQNSLFFSTNSGYSWTLATASGSPIVAIAASASGTKLVGTDGNAILVSTNSGFTWKQTTAPTSVPWSSVASSADGSHLVAVAGTAFTTGPIYTSSDFGATWISNNAPVQMWHGVVSSADGAKLAAIGENGSGNGGTSPTYGIWTSQCAPAPLLNFAATNGFQLSWTIPSTNFVLQQISDLSTGNWADVTNSPVLNLSNLQNEVILPATNNASFFRLKTP